MDDAIVLLATWIVPYLALRTPWLSGAHKLCLLLACVSCWAGWIWLK